MAGKDFVSDREKKIPEIVISDMPSGRKIRICDQKLFWYSLKQLEKEIKAEATAVLEFENCTIVYGTTLTEKRLDIPPNTDLVINNCRIWCGDKIKREPDNFVQEVSDETYRREGAQGAFYMHGNSEAIIQNSGMENMKNFIHGAKEIHVENCRIVNPRSGFLSAQSVNIDNSEIKYEEETVDEWSLKYGSENVICADRQCFMNCRVSDLKIPLSFPDIQVRQRERVWRDCTVKNVHFSLCATKIEKCRFENCSRIFITYDKKLQVKKTQFFRCTHLNDHRGITFQIEESVFLECRDLFVRSGEKSCFENTCFLSCKGYIFGEAKSIMMKNCECKDLRADRDVSVMEIVGDDRTVLENCDFYDIKTKKGYLLECNGTGCNQQPWLVKNCNFVRCSTERSDGKFIRDTVREMRIIKDEQSFWDKIRGIEKVSYEETGEICHIISYENCRGVNRYYEP